MRRSHAIRFAVALCATTGAFAQAHKWVDEKGVTHYSDRPPVNQPSTKVSASGATPAPYPDTMVPVSARPAGSPDSARAKPEGSPKRESRDSVRPADGKPDRD